MSDNIAMLSETSHSTSHIPARVDVRISRDQIQVERPGGFNKHPTGGKNRIRDARYEGV